MEFTAHPVVYDTRLPELRWISVAGATSYLVELTARVPEGPVVDRRVQRVDVPRLDLPRLDDSRPTKITLSVSAQCGQEQGPRAESVWLVMPSARCAAVGELRRDEAARAPRAVRWRAGAGDEFELRTFDARSGALQAQRRTSEARAILPEGSPAVLAVRRLCGGAAGPFSYLLVD